MTVRRHGRTGGKERGLALVLTLVLLLGLGGLVAAYLAVSTLEPQISRNLADGSRARNLAEAGIERGFNVLVAAAADAGGGWSDLLAGATAQRPWVALAGMTNIALGSAATRGTFSVIIRNDNGAADTPLTGLSATTRPAMDTSATTDANATVIMRSAGTFNGLTKTVEVVVRRAALPPLAGAVNIGGVSPDTVVDAVALDFDGRDYGCPGGGTTCDEPSTWTVTANPLQYGVAVPAGAEAPVEAALATPAQPDAVKGKRRADPSGAYTTGREAVAGDDSVTGARMDGFVSALAANPATTVLQSTTACPIAVAGTGQGTTNAAPVGNGCGLATTAYLGSRQDPRVVFVRGDASLDRGLRGAGVLVVQDGRLTSRGDLEWDGVVIVAGRGSSLAFTGSGRTIIRGATIASNGDSGSAGGADLAIGSSVGSISIRSSKQNVEMVKAMRALHSITNWREI
jgi:Tfp pilus assembly protein PilX